MPQYINLISYTEQGLKNMKNMPDRVNAARQEMQNAGGKMISFHLTLGQYDAVVISEFPDDESYATFVLGVAAQGNLRPTTLKAFTEEEASRIVRNIP